MNGRDFVRALMIVGCCAGLIGLVGNTPTGSAATAAPSFVQRDGTSLTLDRSPWRFIAFNDYQLSSLPGAYDCGRAVSSSTLDAIMKDMAASGAGVVRTWFFQSYYDLNSQGRSVTPRWSAFDRVLAAAARHGMKVIPVLVNEWTQCEPGSSPKDLVFFRGGYQHPGYGYPLAFRQYATTVAKHYAGNPQIAFWQLGNELEANAAGGCTPAAESHGAQALRGFTDDMVAAIKHVDPNHLVSLGTIGTGQCGLAGSDYAYVHAGAVDLCEYHDYSDPRHAIPDDGYNRLAQRIAQCQALGKPLFIGESGIPANVAADGGSAGEVTASSLAQRAVFFSAKITAALSAGIDGYGLWDKEQDPSDSAYNLASDGGYGIGPGDPTDAVTANIAGTVSGSSAPSRRP